MSPKCGVWGSPEPRCVKLEMGSEAGFQSVPWIWKTVFSKSEINLPELLSQVLGFEGTTHQSLSGWVKGRWQGKRGLGLSIKPLPATMNNRMSAALNSSGICQVLKEGLLPHRHLSCQRKENVARALPRSSTKMNCCADASPKWSGRKNAGGAICQLVYMVTNTSKGRVPRQSSSLLIFKCHSGMQPPYRM
jgi:hypothetical protein